MRYILAISLLFLSSCKSPEEQQEENRKKQEAACKSDIEYDSLSGNWRQDYTDMVYGRNLPHLLRLRFKPTSSEVLVEYTCGNGYGDVAQSVKVMPGYEVLGGGDVEIGRTGEMEPRGNGFKCKKLGFGDVYAYEFIGRCLALKGRDGGTRYFEKGL